MLLARTSLTAALSLIGFAVLPAVPALAAAPSSCQFYSTKALIVHVAEGEPVTLSQGSSGEINFAVGAGTPAQCSDGLGGTTPTVSEIDTVTIDGYDDLTIDMEAPGGGLAFQQTATGEPGGLDDTYFSLGGSVGFLGELIVLGTDGADDFSARPLYPWGLRLNGDADQDIGLSGSQGSVSKVSIYAGDGNDRVDVSDLESNPVTPFFLQGGAGDDVLHGADGPDVLHGDLGNDELSGGKGDDQLEGHENDDTLLEDNTYTFFSNGAEAITNGGTAVSEVYVNGPQYLSRMRIRVNVDHPSPQDLKITFGPAWNAAVSFELAPSLPNTGQDVWGLVFDPYTGAGAVTGNAPYTGYWTPTDASALRAYFETEYAGSSWALKVQDLDAGTVDTGSLHSWEMAVVGTPYEAVDPDTGEGQGDDYNGGGSGNDTLLYSGRAGGVTVEAHASVPGNGQAGQGNENDFYNEIDKVVGSRNGDSFEGGSGNDSFDGGLGPDSFEGKGGTDVIACGDDVGALDLLDYSLAPSAMTVDLGLNIVSGGDSDVITGCDSVIGSVLHDHLTGSAGPNSLDGGTDGNDTLIGLGGADTLWGRVGQDTLQGGPDADALNAWPDTQPDTYDGGTGNDSLSFSLWSQYPTPVSVSLDGLGNDGSPGAQNDNATAVETVVGTDFNDTLVGSSADEVLIGGYGDDVLDGKGGSDILDGGALTDPQWFPWLLDTQPAGTDSVTYASSAVGVTMDLATEQVVQGAATDTVRNVKKVYGSAHNDVLMGTFQADWFHPAGGNDTVLGRDGADTFSASTTPDGADTWDSGNDAGDKVDYSGRTSGVQLSKDGLANDGASGEGDNLGSAPWDVYYGGSGADTLVGGSSADQLHGNGGNDAMSGRGGNDTLYGELGDDSLNGGSGNDTLHGVAGNDTLLGGDGDDNLLAGDGNDTLMGGNGDDDEYGGLGNDTFRQGETAGANGSDLLRGEGGSDTASYLGRTAAVKASLNGTFDDGASFEQDNVSTDVENLEGTAYNDTLTGSSLANLLRGQGGNDVLNASTGNDTVDGGTGNDTFLMGSVADGKDVFIGGSGTDLADYRLRTAALKVLLDATANDGATGELDWVKSDVENAYGGSGADTLTGSSAANRLYGFNGNDVLTGGLGADYLDGGVGNDSFWAKDGVKDTLNGGTGTDSLKSYDTVDVRSAFP